jgi:hypothetical protein
VLAAAAAFENGLEESIYEDDFSETPAIARHLGVVVRMVGWTLTLAMTIGVLTLGLQRERQRWVESPQVVESGPFVARTLSAGWVETSRAGFVLEIEGQLENTTGEAHWPGTLQLVLLDAAGSRLAVQPIRPGVPLAESVLRETSAEQLSADAEAAGRRFWQTPLGPREVRRFEAIVLEDGLPDDARRFLLEVGPPDAAPIPEPAPMAPAEESPPAGSADPL